MGRQAYLSRLALGRSPFEEPELTESGEFILGSHAHDLDNQVDGYVQRFDNKGLPENRAAKAAAREFRRAKNEALETVGVVRRKNKQEIRQRMRAEKENVAALIRENEYGLWLKAVEPSLTLLSLWWLMSLRSRFQTFQSFSSVALLEIIKSEVRHLGSLTFLTSGLLAWLATMPITFCRENLVDIAAHGIIQLFTSFEEDTVSSQRYATRMNILSQILDFALFALAAPVLMFSDLQTLHLIAPLARPSLSSLIPFTRGSPISIPRFSGTLSGITLLQAGSEACRTSFFIFWLYNRARHAVEAVNYRVVCAAVPRPDLPDRLSKVAARKGDEDEDTILGLWLADGPTLTQQVQYEAHSALDWLRSWRTWMPQKQSHISSEGNIRLKSQLIEIEILQGPGSQHEPRPSAAMERDISRCAAQLAWEEQGQTPPDDLEAWIGLSPVQQTNSTNTPEPEELFTSLGAEFGGEATNNLLPPLLPQDMLARPGIEEAHDRHIPARNSSHYILGGHSLPGPNNDVFWQHRLETYQQTYRDSFRFVANGNEPDGHLQTHENADSAGQSPALPHTRLLPSEENASLGSGRSRSRQRERRESHGRAQQQHRVTSLSNFPADTFAYHMSVVLTTAMMLPLESWYLRALARGFLASPATRAGGVVAAGRIGADVRSLQAWFGGEGGLVGRVRYAGVMMLIWGMQTVVSAGVWGLGTRVAVWIGRSAFEWGKE